MKRSRAPSTSTRPATHRSTFAVALVIAVVSACAEAEPTRTDDILASGEKLYSQFDEELVIRDFFQDRRDGFFLDVGCADPRVGSTTYYLEKHLGWSGIGIDALAEHAPAWEEHRPRSRFFAYLVSDHSDTVESFYRAGARDLSSTEKDRVFKGRQLQTREMQVPTITLNKLLDANGVTEIDFLSMDIEGSEPPALAGFDIDRFRPELVCIEASPSIREAILAYFEAHGYERIERYLEHDRVNWYFRPKNAAPEEPAGAN